MVAISLLVAVQYAKMYVVENYNGYDDEVQDCHIVKAFILLHWKTCRSGCPKFFESEVAKVQECRSLELRVDVSG